jgi:hypothetical protein
MVSGVIVLLYGSLVEVDSNIENSQKLKQLEGGKNIVLSKH